MTGVYGNMLVVPKKTKAGALPTYEHKGTYTPGTGVTARFSDDAGRISASAASQNLQAQSRLAGDIGRAVHIGLNAYEDYSKIKATQLLLEYKKQLNDVLYGNNGLFLRNGEEAFNIDSLYETKAQEIKDKLKEEYNGSLAGNFFDMRAKELDISNMEYAQRYKARQYQAWAVREDNAAADLFADAASANYNNPDEYNRNAAQSLWHMRNSLERQGYGAKAVDKALIESKRQLAKSAFMQALAQEDYAGAERILGGQSGGTLSERNVSANNYGNVKNTRGGYNAYATKQDGLMAVGERVLRYSNAPENGWEAKTLLDMVNIYAPAGDGGNNPKQYADFLAKRLGISPTEPVNWKDPKILAGLIKAMPVMEHGAKRGSVSDDEAMEAAKAVLSGKRPNVVGDAPGKGQSVQYLTGGDLATMRNQLDTARKRKEKELELEGKEQREKETLSLVSGWVDDLKGLSPEDRNLALYKYLETVPQEERLQLETLAMAQLKYADRQQAAKTGKTVSDFVKSAEQEKLSPIQAQEKLASMDIPAESKAFAMKKLFGEVEENIANRAALDDIREKIDNGDITTKTEIEVAAFNSRMTNAQINKALSYFEQGGNTKGTYSLIKTVYKEIKGDNEVPDGLYDTVQLLLPAGKVPTEKELRTAVARAIMEGNLTKTVQRSDGTTEQVKDGWFFGLGSGSKMYEAVEEGRLADWRAGGDDEDSVLTDAYVQSRRNQKKWSNK